MIFRVAETEDLPELKHMYKHLINFMNCQNIQIWNDIYPCEFLEQDVQNNRLYILIKDNEIIAAASLCDDVYEDTSISWKYPAEKALYIDRFAVNMDYSGQGIGNTLLTNLKNVSKNKGAEALRLFIVNFNKLAINLYENNGFTKADGIYKEIIDDCISLDEIGYEIEL